MTVAARMGVSKLAAESSGRRIALTSHGRTVAVIGSAERLDEDARLMREAAAVVLDAAADIVSAKGQLLSLYEMCSRLGVDGERVRVKAAARRSS